MCIKIKKLNYKNLDKIVEENLPIDFVFNFKGNSFIREILIIEVIIELCKEKVEKKDLENLKIFSILLFLIKEQVFIL